MTSAVTTADQPRLSPLQSAGLARVTAFPQTATPRRPARAVRIGLAILAWFNLLSAIAGMAGLTIGGGMGMPTEWLSGTIFHSFFWPGIILGLVVGGVQALALLARRRRLRLTWGMHAAAGLTMMIWIFVELAILNNWSPLHGIYFATGLLQTVGAVLALGAWPRPFWATASE